MTKKTITAKELKQLRYDLADQTESANYWFGQYMLQASKNADNAKYFETLRTKLADREKVVHKLLHNGINLAAELRTERAAHQFTLKAYNLSADAVTRYREKYNDLLTRYCNLLLAPIERIEPPACLKPLDALDYIHGRCS